MDTLLFYTPRSALKAVLYAYCGVVTLGFMKGVYLGWIEYEKWESTRSKVSIGNPMYDPIINTCRDVGYWGFCTIEAGVGSAIIVATAPLSVPFLLKIKSTEPNPEQDSDSQERISIR